MNSDLNAKLRDLKRYGDDAIMFYRSNVFDHSKRVSWLVDDVSSTIARAFPVFNRNRAVALALVHDHIEAIVGEVTLGRKLEMTEEERAALRVRELSAIPVLVERYGSSFSDFDYDGLLREAHDKSSLEMVFVSYFDKLDGFGESMHEVIAGNAAFLRYAVGYELMLKELLKRTVVSELVGSHPLLSVPSHNAGRFAHNLGTLDVSSGCFVYDAWRSLVVNNGGDDMLLDRRES